MEVGMVKNGTTHRGDQAKQLVDMVYSTSTPITFAEGARRLCIATGNQSAVAMFDRRKNQIVALTDGLVVMRGKGKSATFHRGHTTMTHREATTRVATL
jgi:hypothetical protein